MENRKLRKAISIFIALLLFIYVGYQAYQANRSEIYTEEAVYDAAVSDSIEATGFAVREEELLEEDYSGVLNYYVAEGSRVAEGGVIAYIYENDEDAMAQSRLQRIESEIQMLELLSNPSDTYITNPEILSEQINTSLNKLFDTLKRGDYSGALQCRDDFQVAINRKNILTGEETADDYNLRLQELEQEKATLQSSVGTYTDVITAPKAGYFISSADGYEELIDMSKLQNMTLGEIRELMDTEAPGVSKNTVGKICSGFNWYIVVILGKSDTAYLGDITKVSIEIPFIASRQLPAEVVSKSRDAETGDTAVILKLTYMNADVVNIRSETIRINVKDFEGVLVTEKAIHFSDVQVSAEDEDGNIQTTMHENVKGVYIKDGNRLKFVQIFTEKTINGYAICKIDLTDEEKGMLVTDKTIQLYDKVVVGGTDLYDGKLIE